MVILDIPRSSSHVNVLPNNKAMRFVLLFISEIAFSRIIGVTSNHFWYIINDVYGIPYNIFALKYLSSVLFCLGKNFG